MSDTGSGTQNPPNGQPDPSQQGAGDAGAPPEGSQPPGQGPGGEAGSAQPGSEGQAPKQWTPEEAAEVVRLAREEAARYRTQLRGVQSTLETTQTELKKLQDAQLSEQERVQRELEELRTVKPTLEKSVQEAELKYRVAVAAPKLGIVDPEAAVLLMDRSQLVVENGVPTNVDDVLKALVDARPYLKGAASAPAPPAASAPQAGATSPARPTGGTPLTREQVEKMSPEEVQRRWSEIEPLLQSGALNK